MAFVDSCHIYISSNVTQFAFQSLYTMIIIYPTAPYSIFNIIIRIRSNTIFCHVHTTAKQMIIIKTSEIHQWKKVISFSCLLNFASISFLYIRWHNRYQVQVLISTALLVYMYSVQYKPDIRGNFGFWMTTCFNNINNLLVKSWTSFGYRHPMVWSSPNKNQRSSGSKCGTQNDGTLLAEFCPMVLLGQGRGWS